MSYNITINQNVQIVNNYESAHSALTELSKQKIPQSQPNESEKGAIEKLEAIAIDVLANFKSFSRTNKVSERVNRIPPAKKINKSAAPKKITNVSEDQNLSYIKNENEKVNTAKEIEIDKELPALEESDLDKSLSRFPFSPEKLKSIFALRGGELTLDKIDNDYFNDAMFVYELLRTHPEAMLKVSESLSIKEPTLWKIALKRASESIFPSLLKAFPRILFETFSTDSVKKEEGYGKDMQPFKPTIEVRKSELERMTEIEELKLGLKEFRNDDTFVNGNLRRNGLLLEHIPNARKSVERVKIAVRQNYLSFVFAPEKLQKNEVLLDIFAQERIRQLKLVS